MKLIFVTTNKHKYEQACDILEKYNITLEHMKAGYDEPSDLNPEQIVKKASIFLYSQIKRPLFIEDTSVEMEAYPGFPGALPKFVFDHISYEGLFRLLADKSRRATFYSHTCLIYEENNPIIFTGEMKGNITDEVFDIEKDDLPYSKIFIPDGFEEPLVRIDKKKIFNVTHRYKSFEKMGKYVSKI
ncbi:hypothetical protein K9M79_02190 [Candidatus Woesearchaeota archaeon]|nr:hypothetical protein [Candidatus Woesearchaeota archaeon]